VNFIWQNQTIVKEAMKHAKILLRASLMYVEDVKVTEIDSAFCFDTGYE
jgi:hypothetical protein